MLGEKRGFVLGSARGRLPSANLGNRYHHHLRSADELWIALERVYLVVKRKHKRRCKRLIISL
jgi:hypothetical protein